MDLSLHTPKNYFISRDRAAERKLNPFTTCASIGLLRVLLFVFHVRDGEWTARQTDADDALHLILDG
jgi:hypothetical protein